MGRKMKVVESNKKHLTKEEKIARKTIQDRASDGFKNLQVSAPRHFDQVARAEYERIIHDLRTLPVRNLDRAVLESYCVWYSIYKQVYNQLKKTGYTYFDEEKGTVVPSPLVLTLEKATTNITRSASQLGLTVDSRMKMFVPKTEEKKTSIFDKFGG